MAGDSSRLEMLTAPTAKYPLQAVENHVQGQVLLNLHISETGDVESTETLRGDPILVDAAERAARQFRFKPFIKSGRPVKASTKMSFDFVWPSRVAIRALLDAETTTMRVARGVMEANIVHRVQPVYPPEAKDKRIQGDVVLLATIGKDGRIKDLSVQSGPRILEESATSAVRQWRYRPFLLNGEPVEVQTPIKVEFRM